MLLHLTEKSEEPLHCQISRQLTNKIIEGDLSDGAEIDSIRKLATSQRVSINTVKRAYDELEQGGLIISQSGKGFYVASLTPEQKQAIAMQRLWGNHSLLNVVETFSKQLISVFDPELLRNLVEENIKQHLMVKGVFFVILDDRTDDYKILPSKEIKEKFIISKMDNLLKTISELKLPVKIETLLVNNQNSTLGDELTKRKIRLIVPLSERGLLIGFFGLTAKVSAVSYSTNELNLLQVLANQFMTALTTARFYVETIEKRRIDEEMVMARQIQANLLPKELPDNNSFSIAAYSMPSRIVGGDFYDYIPIDDNRFGIVIADACGKGMPAAMLISQIQAMIKSEINHGNDIQETLQHLNQQVVSYTPKDRFVTLFYGIFNLKTNEFEYATAGHEYPIIIPENGKLKKLQAGGPALGIIENASFVTEKIKLHQGESIVFYTDGVTESMNDKKEIYGFERLCELLVKKKSDPADSIIRTILFDLDKFNAGENGVDDRTVLVLKRNNRRVHKVDAEYRKE
jgi:phosphoserine phosphatase RsbU/P